MALLLSKRCFLASASSIRASMATESVRRVSTKNKDLFPDAGRETYVRTAEYCKRKKLPIAINDLKPAGGFPEAKLCTVEVETHQPSILLYFHGGGYSHPAGEGHLGLCTDLARTLRCGHYGMLSYTLLPSGRYPTQLAQAAEALRTTLENYEPRHIALAGDSAGGNLVLGLLAHLKEPHPELEPISMPSKLAAAICISPRCSNATSAQSFVLNAKKDRIDASMMKKFVEAWNPTKGHVWAAADQRGSEFWNSDGVVLAERLLLLAGEDECYLDDIRAFAQVLEAREDNTTGYLEGLNSGHNAADDPVQLITAPLAKHVDPVLEFAWKKPPGSMSQALFGWAARHPIA